MKYRSLWVVLWLVSACAPADEMAFHRPVPAPDGRHLAFMALVDGHWDLFYSGVDGSDLTRLTDAESFDGYAAFSADGGRIAFSRHAGDRGQVLVHDLARAETRALSLGAEKDFGAVWFPDDGGLLFVSERDGNRELYRADPAGQAVHRLTHTPMDEHDPRISPDGRWIAFVGQEGDRAAVYVMAADGSQRRRLTDDGPGVYGIDWSPDGRQLVFNAAYAHDKDLYLVDVDHGAPRRLTAGGGDEHLPVWWPDGQSLVFSGERDGPEQLYRLTLDDGRVEPLTAVMNAVIALD